MTIYRVKKLLICGATCFLLLLAFAFYLGAQTACENSGGVLLQSFRCIDISAIEWCRLESGGFMQQQRPSIPSINITWEKLS
jgi:hypothetical protein